MNTKYLLFTTVQKSYIVGLSSSSKIFPSFLSILAAKACFSPVTEILFLLQMLTNSGFVRMESFCTSFSSICKGRQSV